MEKPNPLDVTTVGAQTSLFCWVRQFWPNVDGTHSLPSGWLACDDGAGEIADFVHLDTTGHQAVLSLIHAKGADSDSANRRVSVSAYEVVVSQAVKNLRHVDRLILEHGLAGGLAHKISQLVWHDVAVSTRPAMLAILGDIGANYRRRVVVIQPHVRKAAVTAARANPNGSEAARLRQLDTLLLSARASCASVGAEFMVVCAN